MKPKDPTNYLLKDLADFNRIMTVFEYLEKRKPIIPEINHYQDIWTCPLYIGRLKSAA